MQNESSLLALVPSGMLMIALQASLFYVGRYFLVRQLYQDYDIRKESALGVPAWFSIIFSLSGGLCVLMLFEILEWMQDLRVWYWKFCIGATLLMLIVILPLLQIYMLTKKPFSGLTLKAKISAISVLWLIWLSLFWKIGYEEKTPFGSVGLSEWIFIQSLTRVGKVGVGLISVLSGFGAIYNAYTYLPLLHQANLDEINKNEIELTNTLQIVSEKQKQLTLELSQFKEEQRGNESGFFTSMINNISQGLTTRNSQSVQSEIDTLANLQSQISSEVNQLNRRKDRLNHSGTVKGKAMDALGYIFGAYCIYRIFMSFINIILDRNEKTDPVTMGLSILVKFWNLKLNQKFWAQQLSFVLIGVLVVFSIRSLLIYFMKLTKVFTSQTLRENLILFLAETMGMYFLSTVLLMRSNFPENYRNSLSLVLGNISFDFFYRWFDLIFLISSLLSIVVLYISHKHFELDYGLAN
ncbi:hypothetical protein K502DRAFT_365078 [Neoconidiobolus thromboides FSU 785]|nr:hypothetical protein K502DRAFT_365078 [Neoconidiobolus thromboides FSU 785]